jgi:hypothetical protein
MPQYDGKKLNYLTVQEIEELAESIVCVFYGGRWKMPQSVDIDRLTTEFLKLPVAYHTFADEDSGKIGFISDGVTPLQIHQNGDRAVVFPRGTIVLEAFLRNPREENRRRFTLAHEVGHYLVDRTISVASFRREYDSERDYSAQELRELFSFQENKIDRLAAAILMPYSLMKRVIAQYTKGKPVTLYGDHMLSAHDKFLVNQMAEAMRVSFTAFSIRAKQLHLFRRRSAEEYITTHMRLGE